LSAMLAKQIARTPSAMRYNMTDELLSQGTQGAEPNSRRIPSERVLHWTESRGIPQRLSSTPPSRLSPRGLNGPSSAVTPPPLGDDAGRNNPRPTLLPRTRLPRTRKLPSLWRKTRQFDGEATRCTGKARPAARSLSTMLASEMNRRRARHFSTFAKPITTASIDSALISVPSPEGEGNTGRAADSLG